MENPRKVFPNAATTTEYSLDGTNLYVISNGYLAKLAPNSEYRKLASVTLKFDDPRVARGKLHPAENGDLILQGGDCWIIKPDSGATERIPQPQIQPGEESIVIIAASADGSRVVTDTLPVKVDIALLSLKLWDIKKESTLWEERGVTAPLAHFSPTGNSALIAFKSTIVLVDGAGTISRIRHDNAVMAVGADWAKSRVFVADGAAGLACYSFDGKVLWEQTRGAGELTVGPQSDIIAIASNARVTLLDASNGHEVDSFEISGKFIHDIAIHPVRRDVAVGGDRGLFVYSY